MIFISYRFTYFLYGNISVVSALTELAVYPTYLLTERKNFMADLSKNGKYLNLEGFRASYRADDDTIHLTSTDPDFPEGFHLTLKDGSPTERALRTLLIESNLIEFAESEASLIPRGVAYPEHTGAHPYLFPLGVGSKRDVLWDVRTNAHMLLSGATGSGKSAVVRNIISHCIAHSDKWDMVGVDLAKVDFFPYSDHMVEVFYTIEDALGALQHLKEIVMQRYTLMEDQGVNHFTELDDPPKAIMFIVSELGSLIVEGAEYKQFGQDINMLLVDVTRLGRAAGVHLVVSTQIPEVKVVSAGLSNGLDARILMGRTSSTQSYLTLRNGNGTKVNGSIRGRGIAQFNGEEHQFQAYFQKSGDF